MINDIREVQSAVRVLCRKCSDRIEGAGKTSKKKIGILGKWVSANKCTANDAFTQGLMGFWKERKRKEKKERRKGKGEDRGGRKKEERKERKE